MTPEKIKEALAACRAAISGTGVRPPHDWNFKSVIAVVPTFVPVDDEEDA